MGAVSVGYMFVCVCGGEGRCMCVDMQIYIHVSMLFSVCVNVLVEKRERQQLLQTIGRH